MKKLILAITFSCLSSAALAMPATMTTFFGEDTSTGGTLGPNSSAARADFLTNLTGVGNEDFESFEDGEVAPLNVSFPGSSGSLSATLNGTANIEDDAGIGRFPTSGSTFLEAETGEFSIDFAPGISAFGFNGIDIGDFVTDQLNLTLAGGETVVLEVPHSLNIGNNAEATLFYGFYDTANTFDSITFTNEGGGDIFAFDDMVVGDLEQVTPTPSVPEPASLGLLCLGLLGLGFRRFKA